MWLLLPIQVWAQFDVVIENDPGDAKRNIQLYLANWDSLPSEDIESLKQTFDPRVKQALRAIGYYDPSIQYALQKDLLIQIVLGEPTVWRKANVSVRHPSHTHDNRLQTLINSQPFTPGKRINHQEYEAFKTQLLTLAIDSGYFNAHYTTSELRIDAESHHADVNLSLEAGFRHRIVEINFSETTVEDELLRRIIEVEPGDWYSVNSIGEIYNRLLSSGYFEHVAINVERQPPDQITLHIEMTEQPRFQFSTGLGLTTNDNGLRFRFKWLTPKLNYRGDSLLTQLRASEVEQDITFGYQIPWPHPQKSYISLDSGWKHKVTTELESSETVVGASYNRATDSGWQYSYLVEYKNETSQLSEQEQDSFTYVMPGVNISKRYLKGIAADPDLAFRMALNFGASVESLGSDTNFYELNLSGGVTYRLFGKHSLVSRLDLGFIDADDFLLVPPSIRYFTGGDQTIRGYRYESIAPVDPDGNAIGGNELIVGGLEYQYKIFENWKIALFYDTGRVRFDNQGEFVPTIAQQDAWVGELNKADNFYGGAGVGVRWKTPVGALALDVATPTNQEDSDYRVHFYFGTVL
ncbi:autotransporter assembly complex protein TamA [Aurantivibrio plasticivorans]